MTETLTRRAVRPYDRLRATDRAQQSTWLTTLTRGWSFPGHPPIPVTGDGPWDELPTAARSWVFNAHAWEPLGPLLAEYSDHGNPQCLQASVAYATGWLDRESADAGDPSDAPWGGMAIGLRAYRLAYLLDVLRATGGDPDLIDRLARATRVHARALADPERFVERSNHGVIQAAGQLAMATRLIGEPLMRASAAQAQARLLEVLRAHTSAEGVYLEHSPTYHQSVLDTLAALDQCGLLTDEELRAWIPRLAAGLAAFMRPDGRLVNFGDTDADARARPDLLALAPPDAIPAEGILQALPASGYAMVRDARRQGSTYLALNAAFHSRVHRHADDLSFVWFDGGRDLLVDSGRYGYAGQQDPDSGLGRLGHWYGDPARVYVESTRAHNTVEVDGVSNPRRSRPYGSALTRWAQADGVAIVEGLARIGAVVQRRLLIARPGEWLIVVDSLADPGKGEHDYVQRFHFAPDLDVQGNAAGARASAGTGGPLLHMTALLEAQVVRPVRGQESPDLLGWVAPRAMELEPAWTAGYEAGGVRGTVFATLFRLGAEAPEAGTTRINATARRGQCAWTAAGVAWLVEYDGTDESGPLTLAVRRKDA